MEYGCAVAGAKVVLVMGHTRCGAVGAAVNLAGSKTSAEEATGCQHLGAILQDIQAHFDPTALGDLTSLSESDRQSVIDDVALTNVKQIVAGILAQSGTLAKLVAERKIAIVGSMYDVTSGHIHFIEEATAGLSEDELRNVLSSGIPSAD
jgi:carbonic anhydrase/SulP family sulfate permease